MITIDVSFVLYIPKSDIFTHCYSVFGLMGDVSKLDDLKQLDQYKSLVSIGKAASNNPYCVCIFQGDYKDMSTEEIKCRCKEYCENQTK
ncbi:MAG TPA: hypothetical protein GXZ90_09830 [Clostridiales bacterium]|nr:hypothetical protein [Clostridiales bacterium]